MLVLICHTENSVNRMSDKTLLKAPPNRINLLLRDCYQTVIFLLARHCKHLWSRLRALLRLSCVLRCRFLLCAFCLVPGLALADAFDANAQRRDVVVLAVYKTSMSCPKALRKRAAPAVRAPRCGGRYHNASRSENLFAPIYDNHDHAKR